MGGRNLHTSEPLSTLENLGIQRGLQAEHTEKLFREHCTSLLLFQKLLKLPVSVAKSQPPSPTPSSHLSHKQKWSRDL